MTDRSIAATGALSDWADQGHLAWSDVQLARHLGHLFAEPDDRVVLAAACTFGALRAGSVCLDLARPPVEGADWPEPDEWATALDASPLVTQGDGPASGRPLRLAQGLLYLERSWDDQESVARSILARLAESPPPDKAAELRLRELFGSSPGPQRDAAASALAHRFTVVGGGPGTGKTTTVARILATLADPERPPRVALAAPTGKAAARLDQAVRQNLATLGLSGLADAIPAAATIHRLLGIKPWGAVERGPARPLAVDAVVVDEVSMLSLHHLRLLLDALPPAARLVLVGDPDQLASVESGAVLADLVAVDLPHTFLDQNYRFSGDLTALARGIRLGDAAAVLDLVGSGSAAIEWVDAEPSDDPAPENLRRVVVDQATAVLAALANQDYPAALARANRHRVLCAHRHGPAGVARWGARVAGWIAAAIPAYGRARPWCPGLPVQATRNDEILGTFNGDVGVVADVAGRLRVALETSAGIRLVGPAELDGLEPIHATTIHKAQGSQFDSVTVVVPSPGTSLLSRELLYTAVTRATQSVRLIGTAEALAHAVDHPASRASGLADRLGRALAGPR